EPPPTAWFTSAVDASRGWRNARHGRGCAMSVFLPARGTTYRYDLARRTPGLNLHARTSQLSRCRFAPPAAVAHCTQGPMAAYQLTTAISPFTSVREEANAARSVPNGSTIPSAAARGRSRVRPRAQRRRRSNPFDFDRRDDSKSAADLRAPLRKASRAEARQRDRPPRSRLSHSVHRKKT